MHLVAIGGSDAGISAALRAKELDPSAEVTVVVADRYPNFSICGIPYYLSGEVPTWQRLAHRTIAELEATGMRLRLDTTVQQIDSTAHSLTLASNDGRTAQLNYDALVVGTGALPVVPRIDGLTGTNILGPRDGVHLLHSMDDARAIMATLDQTAPKRAVIVGAGYIGLEMAEALTARGLQVTQVERLPEVFPTIDPSLGALVREELQAHGVTVLCRTEVTGVTQAHDGSPTRLLVHVRNEDDGVIDLSADIVIVVVGVRPDSALAARAGAQIDEHGAIVVDHYMRTNLPDVFAAGDCVTTHHRLLGNTYLPLGTTAHKQGRIAGENAVGGDRAFAGVIGTQVVKVFDQVIARTGIRGHEAKEIGYDQLTIEAEADDHKAYYPGSHRIAMRFTADRASHVLLGVQMFGHQDSAIAKRIDIASTAIFHQMTVDELSDLDLSYTPPLGSPWDAVQMGAQQWSRIHRHHANNQ
jgi:NADPH-dependent 2,4-dienoyl-CoA reductase/sulfur reductase-like enzyme